jgi:hypothetical protein
MLSTLPGVIRRVTVKQISSDNYEDGGPMMTNGSIPQPLTDEQLSEAVASFAQGMKPSDVAKQIGISTYRAKGLLKRKDVADSIDRMRLTDTIPRKLDSIMDTMLAAQSWLENADSRLCALEEQARKTKTAMQRLNVENKHLRETRRDARKELREAKAALWRARGY